MQASLQQNPFEKEIEEFKKNGKCSLLQELANASNDTTDEEIKSLQQTPPKGKSCQPKPILSHSARMEQLSNHISNRISDPKWEQDVRRYKQESTPSKPLQKSLKRERVEVQDSSDEESSESEEESRSTFQRKVLQKFRRMEHLESELKDIKQSIKKILQIVSKKD